MRVVIVGNGPASASAIEAFRKVDKDSDIIVLSDEEFPTYAPNCMENVIRGDISEEALFYKGGFSFYEKYKVDFRPLKEVPERIKSQEIIKKVKLISREFKRLFDVEPTIGILGLNPHAGDMGTIGEEDVKEIAPAVEALKAEGYKGEGPLSPDSALLREDLDLYLCMYHDQGLIPLKLLAFKEGVNLTLGLPLIRTSPDHGVAYDIAWKGIADESPSLSALRLCEKLVEKTCQ